MRVAGVVLAAGAGRRMGQPKAGVLLGGQRLVDRQVALLRRAGCDVVVVVLGAAVLDVPDAEVVVNQRWAEGMGSSLGVGLGAVGDVDAAVVVLVDQPRLDPAAVTRTVAAVAAGAVAARATYGARPGHPVVFARTVWAEASRSATGDVGAKEWLADNAAQVALVPCDGLGDDGDVDTLEELRAHGRGDT